MATEHAKPVKLQINTSGAWKDLVRFDAANDVMTSEVMDAAERLGRIDDTVTFRVSMVTSDGQVLTLSRWSSTDGWKAVKHG